MQRKYLLLPLLLLLAACSPNTPPLTNSTLSNDEPVVRKHPKNIILMIGDGMGLTQITAGLYKNGKKLNLEKFPIVGLQKSYSGDNLVTDSAAGATAFSAGVKTYNGAIGVRMDSTAVKTILEEAEERGMATGMIATSTIVHATPAAFIAHVKSRNDYEDIAADFLKTNIDFFVGGGKSYFDKRKDGRDLIGELRSKNYFVSSTDEEDLTKVAVDFNRNFAFFTADADPAPVSKGRDYLTPATKLATLFLEKKSDKGFFLMVEGSQIDWGGHGNNSDYIISEMIDFDKAIGAALDFAKEDGETLIVITADHETGGYAINTGSTMDNIIPRFTTKSHTAVLIPVFAYGPGSELFGGIYENTAIYDKMRLAFGF